MGVVGANGSGKTTLMNVLFGNSIISETGGYTGEIYIDGEKVEIPSSADAIRLGLGMVHQEFMLIPEMSVEENVTMGKEASSSLFHKKNHALGWLNQTKNQAFCKKTMESLGMDIPPKTPVKFLSITLRQFVEIAREISRNPLRLLLLDEPTAALNYEDSLLLLQTLRELAGRGVSILFCSHRLQEICRICDRVIVLRDGKQVDEYTGQEMRPDRMAKAMIGHTIRTVHKTASSSSGETILQFSDYQVAMPADELRGLNLSVLRGEILGISSLSGGGKSAVGYGLMGMFPSSGRVQFHGEEISSFSATKLMRQGILLLPDDRKQQGILADKSVTDNIVFTAFHAGARFQKRAAGLFFVKDKKAASTYASQMISRLQIKCSSPEQPSGELSGGNQQKVCIARTSAMNPEVLFVYEPTRGVDVEAKEKILELLVRMNKEEQTTIVMISSELDELVRVCDRIAVLCEGTLSAILPPDATEEAFGLAYAGEWTHD